MIRVVLPSGTQIDFPNCLSARVPEEDCILIRSKKEDDPLAFITVSGMVVCLKPEEMRVNGTAARQQQELASRMKAVLSSEG